MVFWFARAAGRAYLAFHLEGCLGRNSRDVRRVMKSKANKSRRTKPAPAKAAPARAIKASASRSRPRPKPLPAIPAILLEGDPVPPPPALPPAPPVVPPVTHVGTARIHLVAREPLWLYAHWEMTPEHAKHWAALASDGCLTLHVYSVEGERQVCE